MKMTLDNLFDYVCPEPNTGCWLWCGQLNDGGYGRVHTTVNGKRRRLAAHCEVYKLVTGKRIHPLHVLDHKCRTRACCNPDHLEPVTERVNIRRGMSPSGHASRKTHCVNGHPFNRKNTYRRSDGNRDCRECKRTRRKS